MGPKKEPKLSRFLPLDDTARLPALLSSLTLLGSDTMQDLEEGTSNIPVQSVAIEVHMYKASPIVSGEGALSCSTCQVWQQCLFINWAQIVFFCFLDAVPVCT